jgi:serine/threonine-protein kinase
MARRPGADPQAFDLYLRARYYWGQSSQASWGKARTLLEEAAARDPGFALPHAGLADLYLQLPLFHFAPPIPRSEAQARGRTAALRAIELDDDLAEAHTALATARWYDWDWDGAERSFQHAIERNPSYATAHQRYGLCLAFLGRFDEAAERVELAARLDPLSLSAAVSRAVVDLLARRYDAARERLQSVLETDPNFFPALHHMAELERYTDHYAASLAINVRLGLLTRAEHDELLATIERGDIAAYHRGVVRALRHRDASPTILAAGLSHAGDDTAAWDAIERAFHERDPVLTDGVRIHPGLDLIRRQPRFASLRSRMGITE